MARFSKTHTMIFTCSGCRTEMFPRVLKEEVNTTIVGFEPCNLCNPSQASKLIAQNERIWKLENELEALKNTPGFEPIPEWNPNTEDDHT